jgi:hypothetical protein
MNKHTVIAFLLGWFLSLVVSPATLLGMAKGITSGS